MQFTVNHIRYDLMCPSSETFSSDSKYLQCAYFTATSGMNVIKTMVEVNHDFRHKKIISELLKLHAKLFHSIWQFFRLSANAFKNNFFIHPTKFSSLQLFSSKNDQFYFCHKVSSSFLFRSVSVLILLNLDWEQKEKFCLKNTSLIQLGLSCEK